MLLKEKYPIIKGSVVRGQQLGASIGSPTANLMLESEQAKEFRRGVYAVKVFYDSMIYEGVANIGLHPTVGESDCLLAEVHIFDFDRDIYGCNIQIEPIHFIREEQKFKDVKALRDAIKKDILSAKTILR